jgi:hypothetical protein
MSWRQVIFPDQGSPILSQHESAIVLNAARSRSIFEVDVWGTLFYATKIEEDHNGTLGVHLNQFVGYVLLFIEHVNKMLQALGYGGSIRMETTLTSILGVQWLYDAGGCLSAMAGSELDDNVTFSVTTSTEALRERPHGVAMDILRDIFFSVNWANLVDTPEKLERLVRAGYKFNFWPNPANLRI